MTRLETRLHILGLWRMVPWEVAKAHFHPFSRHKCGCHTAITMAEVGRNRVGAHGIELQNPMS